MASLFESILGFGIAGEAASEQQHMLNMQEKAVQMKASQDSIARSDHLMQTISTARATEAARGIGLSSPSFKAVQRTSFNNYNTDEKFASLNLLLKQSEFSEKRAMIRTKKESQELNIFSSFLDTAAMFLL